MNVYINFGVHMEFHWVGWPKTLIFGTLLFFYFGMFYVIQMAINLISSNHLQENRKQIKQSLMLMHYSLMWLIYSQAGNFGIYSYTGSVGTYVNIGLGSVFILIAFRSLMRILRIVHDIPAEQPKKKWYEKDPNKKEWYENK